MLAVPSLLALACVHFTRVPWRLRRGSGSGMCTPEEIELVCGAEALAYARNKNRGGRAGAKGRAYELSYGAYRIAVERPEAHSSCARRLE
jgi:hypothetical protein